MIHQRVAQTGVLDPLHRLADEGLDQAAPRLPLPECRVP